MSACTRMHPFSHDVMHARSRVTFLQASRDQEEYCHRDYMKMREEKTRAQIGDCEGAKDNREKRASAENKWRKIETS